jgi:phosphoglycolate phosphatase
MSIDIDLMVFDLDGTLVDSKQDLANSVNHALETMGFEKVQDQIIFDLIGEGLRELLAKSFKTHDDNILDEAIPTFRSHYREHLLDNTKLYPGVDDVLKHFNIKKALVTNKPEGFSRTILERLHISSYFDMVLGVDNVENRKPHPEPLLKTLDFFGVQKERCLVIGDSNLDIEMGKGTGTLTCGVTYGFRDRKDLEEAGADYIIDDIKELKTLINKKG